MLRNTRSLKDSQGFTLIELLIVVVIIGILAAIAIPQFASTKEKAFDAAAKSDLHNMMSAEEAYFSNYQTYTDATVTPGGSVDLGGSGQTFTASEGVQLGVTAATNGYTATAKHTSSTSTWCINTTPTGTSKINRNTGC